MKRIFVLILCLTLIFLLTACGKGDQKELTLDDQIKQAYLNKTGEKAPLEEMSIRYIYTFEDAYAVFVDCSLWVAGTAITNVQVGDYLFTFSSTQEILIYKDGTCYSLTEAYDQKVLTNEQWQTLLNTWKAQVPYLYEEDGECNEVSALDCQIKQAYLDKTKEEAPHNEMTIRYIYTFEDAYAVFVDCSLWEAPSMSTDVMVGDYLFTFSTTQEMLIYKDGTCYSLTEAYDQKVLTNEQWKVLYDAWMGMSPNL